MRTILTLLITFLFLADASSQIGRLALSPLQTLEQKIGLTDITIVYSRPSMRGRMIFGDLVPYDKMWRTGANRNTTIEFSENVVINGQAVKAGKYAIFTIPSQNQWEAIFYNDTSNWDVPEEFDEDKVVARMKSKPVTKANKREALAISIGDFTNYKFDLNINWSDTHVSFPIELNTRTQMDKKISKTLGGPSYDDHYLAAVYQMESGEEYEKGLQQILKAMEVVDEVTFWDYRVQAILLMKMGKNDEAREIAKKGLMMANEVQSEYGINEFEKVLKKVGN